MLDFAVENYGIDVVLNELCDSLRESKRIESSPWERDRKVARALTSLAIEALDGFED